jgi:hypothetical protein
MRALGGLFLVVGLVLAVIAGAWGRSGFYVSQAPILFVLAVGALICLGAGAAMLRYRRSGFDSGTRAQATLTDRVLAHAATDPASAPPVAVPASAAADPSPVDPAPVARLASIAAPPATVDEATRDRSPRVGDWVLILPDATVLPITDGLVIGRQPVSSDGESAAAVPSLEVSKSHARFGIVQGQLRVRDLDTTNGTVVVHPDGSEESVSPRSETPLGRGDRLEIGSYALQVELRS